MAVTSHPTPTPAGVLPPRHAEEAARGGAAPAAGGGGVDEVAAALGHRTLARAWRGRDAGYRLQAILFFFTAAGVRARYRCAPARRTKNPGGGRAVSPAPPQIPTNKPGTTDPGAAGQEQYHTDASARCGASDATESARGGRPPSSLQLQTSQPASPASPGQALSASHFGRGEGERGWVNRPVWFKHWIWAGSSKMRIPVMQKKRNSRLCHMSMGRSDVSSGNNTPPNQKMSSWGTCNWPRQKSVVGRGEGAFGRAEPPLPPG
eukprot:gene22572-biopygen7218